MTASLRGKTEMESQCPSCKIKISKTDASPSTDLETMLSLLQTQCKLCSKKFNIANHVQYINHTQNCLINELQNKPVLVIHIFSIYIFRGPYSKDYKGCSYICLKDENEIQHKK